jgi:hypothetical protein
MKTISISKGLKTIVDDFDYEYLNQFKWFASYRDSTKSHVAVRHVNKGFGKYDSVYMHRDILRPEPHLCVDHINHDTLDNRRANIRVVTHQENHRNHLLNANNTSGACGVSWHSAANKWRAHIRIDGRQIYLGCFSSKEDAIEARVAASISNGFHNNHGKRIEELSHE